jgi:hypothetical protein
VDELLLIARQYRRVERDNIANHGFGVQLPRYLLSLFIQDTRARTEHRWVTVPFCDRVDEPVNLAIELSELQFEVGTRGIRPG